MTEVVNQLIHWLRENMDVLSQLGAAAVVVGGAIWQIYRYFDERRRRDSEGRAPASATNFQSTDPMPVVAPPAVTSEGSHQTRRRVLEGRNSLSSVKGLNRAIAIYACFFSLFWSLCVIFFLKSTVVSMAAAPMFNFVSVFVGVFLVYIGIAMFLHAFGQIAGRVKVIATKDVLYIETSTWLYLEVKVALAEEWRFDGENMVSRINGGRIGLPVLPPYVKLELESWLARNWT